MLFENTVKLNWGNLQICFNAAEDIQYLARAWLQQATATVLTLVLLPEVLLLENDLKNNYSWSTWCDYLKIRVNFTELRRKTLTERNVSKWSMVLGQTLYSIPAIFTDTSVKIRGWDKINFIWKYDQTELGRFTELFQCCWRHTVPGKGGVVVASVNDCNGFDVGVTSGGFVSEEELKHTAVALLVLSFVNTCKLNWRTRITGENWEICVQMVNSLRVDFIHDTRHLCTSVKIDDIIAMSPGFLKGKQVVKSANTRNGVQVCFIKTKTTTKLC